jgi:hypothetical protein
MSRKGLINLLLDNCTLTENFGGELDLIPEAIVGVLREGNVLQRREQTTDSRYHPVGNFYSQPAGRI